MRTWRKLALAVLVGLSLAGPAQAYDKGHHKYHRYDHRERVVVVREPYYSGYYSRPYYGYNDPYYSPYYGGYYGYYPYYRPYYGGGLVFSFGGGHYGHGHYGHGHYGYSHGGHHHGHH